MSFVNDFDPERGDVIYGISPARTAYKNAWLAAQMAYVNKHTLPTDPHFKQVAALGWHQMDEYNNYFGVPTISGTRTAADADLHLAAKSADAVNNHDASKNLERVRQYKDVLATSRFSPSQVFNAAAPKLAKEGYNATQYADGRSWLQKKAGTAKAKSSAAQALAQNVNYLAIRRACKFGIGLVATGDKFQHAMVHFVLDGLDMNEVCTKGTRHSQGQGMLAAKTFVSITVSELRYVCRNWGKLSAKVVLYVNLQPVTAPWLNDWGPLAALAAVGGTVSARKDLWDAYGLQRMTKYGDALPDKALV